MGRYDEREVDDSSYNAVLTQQSVQNYLNNVAGDTVDDIVDDGVTPRNNMEESSSNSSK